MFSNVSMGVYKIYCDLTNRPHGITVLNKKTSRLRFASGEQLPVFSTHMFILGQAQYLDAGYFYDNLALLAPFNVSELTPISETWEAINIGDISETVKLICEFYCY